MSKYIDAGLLRKDIDNWNEAMTDAIGEYSDGIRFALNHFTFILDSIQQEPIEKDEDAEKLILCDILEATVARINGGKVDKEKEENIMMEKINYLRNLGLKAKEK